MLNKKPIFINGFQRGGTNILMNLFASHPDVCMLGGETQVVFYGRSHEHFKKWIPRLMTIPIFLFTRQHTFWPFRYFERNQIPSFLWSYIDFLLYMSKMFASRNKVRNSEERNTIIDIHHSRLLSKNVNGVVLATPLFSKMYPDAQFIGLVRNGLAICESFVRRGKSPEKIGYLYKVVCQQMLDDAKRIKNYNIIYFEDLIASPEKVIRDVYEFSELQIEQTQEFRLQAKKVMDHKGKWDYIFGGEQDRETHWFMLETI